LSGVEIKIHNMLGIIEQTAIITSP
jgi:hypothetical protein